MMLRMLGCIAMSCVAAPAFGQTFNIDIGLPGAGPSSSYAAAGLPGSWNSVRADHIVPFTPGPTAQDIMLVDVFGNQTSVGFHQFGATDLSLDNDPSLGRDDASMMTDSLITHSTGLESCMYLNGLENGTYEVLIYAWMPGQPSVMQKVRFDSVLATTLVGGTWTGGHVEGVTYARYEIEVTSGRIGVHVGIPSGGDTVIGAAFNAMQIAPLGAGAPVPAVSTWGLITLALLTLSAGTMLFRRQPVTSGL